MDQKATKSNHTQQIQEDGWMNRPQFVAPAILETLIHCESAAKCDVAVKENKNKTRKHHPEEWPGKIEAENFTLEL